MKKIFTLLAVSAMAFGAYADDLTVETDGTLTDNGSTILFNTMKEADFQLGMANVGGFVKVTSNVDDKEVSVKFTAAADNPDVVQMCTTKCYDAAPGKVLEENVTLMEEEQLSMVIDARWMPATDVRTYKAVLEIFDGGAAFKTYNIVMTNDPNYSGVTKLTADGAFRVNGKTVTWTGKAVPGTMSVYTADGRLAGSYNLTSASGSLTLDLAPGLYIWSAAGTTGKVLIGK